jgi:hypothetical protein
MPSRTLRYERLQNEYPALTSSRTMALFILLLIVMIGVASVKAPEPIYAIARASGPIDAACKILLLAFCLKYLGKAFKHTRRFQVPLLRQLLRSHSYSPEVMSLKLTYKTAQLAGKVLTGAAVVLQLATGHTAARLYHWAVGLIAS